MILFFTLLTKKRTTGFNLNSVYFHSGSHARTSKNHVLVRHTKFYSFQNSSCYDDKKTNGKKRQEFLFSLWCKSTSWSNFCCHLVVIHSIFISVSWTWYSCQWYFLSMLCFVQPSCFCRICCPVTFWFLEKLNY